MDAARQVMLTAEAIETGGPDLAASRITPLLTAYPEHPEVMRLNAAIFNLRGDFTNAVTWMQRAITRHPDDALYYNTLGAFLGNAGDYDAAIESLRKACELDPDLAIAWFNLGGLFIRCMRRPEATDALRRSIALRPDYMPARALLGDLLRAQNRINEASDEYRQIIAEQPWSGPAWWGLADLKTLTFSPTDITQLRAALVNPHAQDSDQIAMGMALAKALEDQGQYAESLQALQHAHGIARRRRVWNAKALSDGISAIMDAFTPAPAGALTADTGSGVIFITSLPRSGSTLVEQILASHSQVEGAGELPDLAAVLTEQSRRSNAAYPAWVRDMQPTDWQRIGDRYLERTARWHSKKPIVVDKLPANWYYIGAIRAMLPAAKIICCRRDPLETCFSCYRQNLDNNEYTRTFADLAAYWRDFDRSVRHFHHLHPAHLYELSYEELVNSPDTAIRQLLDFCGLPFEESCLHFYASTREVGTPSAMQVRQPLRTDTARGPRYGALLDPLRTALGLPLFRGA